ncbi:glycosyltransferase family 39 protein [Frigoriglobus tundricola]|uniref:GT83 family glycosyltransferase n=1 Tax=Frigoriglobus tundricola TaxID=2774151 RepID=A0A6M5YS73_9BACT|nr:glycosyltransferase family 39 protein [Frigoriglobus tundricola]QJW96895.1 GT83 family glycosyltransferase [Frigoriglobus tundricola]
MRRERLRDYAILLAASAALTLPNLGATSLWDVDEGVNAEAAREMRDNGTWVIPTFNYQLRTAKPVMLYWLQRGTYTAFGVSEWSARLPSVLAAWLTVLLTYELARGMFGRTTGLLAGVVLASAVEFCVLAHAATPDATLLLFTVLTYRLFWSRHENGARVWWVPTAAACGLAVLTKGPVGLALPGLVILTYFAWNRELGRLLDRKLWWAVLTFALVAGPWYGLVTAETRGVWAGTFFGRENLQRFTTPMENHRGPVLYHAAALLVLFTPWSAFLLGAVWYGLKATRREEPNPPTPFPKKEGGAGPSAVLSPSPRPGPREAPLTGPGSKEGGVGEGASPRPYRFLICWFAAYLVFFSAAATKLPNYMLPVYPALAILTARFLVRWRAGDLTLPRWMMPAAVAGVVVTAVAVFGGLLVAGDAVQVLPAGSRVFPGLERWAVLAAVPLAAAVVMARAVRANDRARFVRAMTVGAVTFTALAAAFPSLSVDEQKAPKELVRLSGVDDPSRDIRLGHFDWFQPSLVFYARRELVEVFSPDKAAEFLAVPTPGYLFVPAKTWEQVEPKLAVPTRIVARHRDFYRNCDILVVTNEVTVTAGR